MPTKPTTATATATVATATAPRFSTRPATKSDGFPTLTVTLSREQAKRLIAKLFVASQWFEVMPLPGDRYMLYFRAENAARVRQWVAAICQDGPRQSQGQGQGQRPARRAVRSVVAHVREAAE